MRRADIKPGTEYAVSIKARPYDKTNVILRGTVEKTATRAGCYSVLIPKQVAGDWSHAGPERRVIYLSNIIQPWSEYIEEQERVKAESAAWEAKRAEERERFEVLILPAFKGIATDNYVSRNGAPDLADYIEETMLVGGSSTVTLREKDLRGIADRIAELTSIVNQNALVAGDPPEAGWAPVLQEPLVAERVEEAVEEEAQTGREPIIEIPLSALGLDVGDGDS